jgi:hypothetical protein
LQLTNNDRLLHLSSEFLLLLNKNFDSILGNCSFNASGSFELLFEILDGVGQSAQCSLFPTNRALANLLQSRLLEFLELFDHSRRSSSARRLDLTNHLIELSNLVTSLHSDGGRLFGNRLRQLLLLALQEGDMIL